jgi:predicted transcriptional regulator
MTEMTIELPDELAEAIEQKATELGTTPDQLLSAVVTEAVAEIPELETDDDWQYR